MQFILIVSMLLGILTSCTVKHNGPFGEFEYRKIDLSKLESMKKGVACEENYFDPTSNIESKLSRMIPQAKANGKISEVIFAEYSYEESVGIYKKYCLISYGK